MKPGKRKKNWKWKKDAMNKFTFTEDQQRHYKTKVKTVDLWFVIVRSDHFDSFAGDDIVPLKGETCRTYVRRISGCTFNYQASVYALFLHDFLTQMNPIMHWV